MKSRWVIPLVGLLFLAGTLRFYRLGDWSLAGDETASFEEVDSLFQHSPAALNKQIDTLPKLIPLAHATLHFGYLIFGRSEWGSRALPAILGSVGVGLFYLLLAGPLGRLPALATAIFVALWPEHLFHSQENRFYIPAELVASLCMAAGGIAAHRRSLAWMIAACLLSLLAIFFHTTLALLQIGLVISFTVASLWDGRRGAWHLLGAVLLTAVASRFLFTGYLMPIYRTWNSGSGWGYGPIQASLSSIAQLGLPVVLLAALGGFFAICERSPQGFYWLVWGGLWIVVSVCLPFMMVYQPSYAFSFAPAMCVLAGLGVARVYERLRPGSPIVAAAWLGLVFLLNAPSVLSHYVDGSRHDFRAAAWYVADHFQDHDRIASMSTGVLCYYSPLFHSTTPLTAWDLLPDLKAATARPGRVWIVIATGRSGMSADLTRWLCDHARLEARFRQRRFDYYDFEVEVYLRP
jgi:hypothetical protein